MALGDLIDRVEASTDDNPAPYLRNQALAEWPPELSAEVSPMPDCTQPNWLESRVFPKGESLSSAEVYIGGQGAQFPVLHYDGLHTHAFLMQLYGDKEYIVFSPEQTRFMYPQDGAQANKSRIVDLLVFMTPRRSRYRRGATQGPSAQRQTIACRSGSGSSFTPPGARTQARAASHRRRASTVTSVPCSGWLPTATSTSQPLGGTGASIRRTARSARPSECRLEHLADGRERNRIDEVELHRHGGAFRRRSATYARARRRRLRAGFS